MNEVGSYRDRPSNIMEGNSRVYHSQGTWYLSNWWDKAILETNKKQPGLLSSPEIVPQSFNLTTCSIVGVKGGTRKRPRGRLSGSWWTGCGWGPGARCPWKVGRRRIFVSESPAEEVEVMEIESILKERAGLVVELSTDYKMDIQEGHMMEAVRARESVTDFQQTELMDTDTELGIALTSDKDKDCVTGYWAQECPFPGTEERASCD